MLRKVTSWMLALFWVGVVLLAPSSASWAVEESPSPSVSPSPSATPSEPPATSDPDPEPTPDEGPTSDLLICTAETPCVVTVDDDMQTWLLFTCGALVLVGSAALVSQWGPS